MGVIFLGNISAYHISHVFTTRAAAWSSDAVSAA